MLAENIQESGQILGQDREAKKEMKPSYLCPTKFCRHKRGKNRGPCSRCQMRAWRAKNKMKATLAMLRDRAARKNVPFDLDLDWLTEFLTVNGYDSKLHHIDRIKTWEGYTKFNLQILPCDVNIAKGNRERRGQLPLIAECPF